MKNELDNLGKGLLIGEKINLFTNNPGDFNNQNLDFSQTDKIFNLENKYNGSTKDFEQVEIKDVISTESFSEINDSLKLFVPLTKKEAEEGARALRKIKGK